MRRSLGILLRTGQIALISEEDAYLCRLDWTLRTRPDGTAYVVKRTRVRSAWAADMPPLLHRAVLRPADGEIIDHINGHTLDNRRENLRIVPHAVNSHNTTSSRKNLSHGAIGVTWNKRQWQAQIRVNGRLKHIGVYPTFEAAREARRVAEIKLWGVEPRRESELLVN